MFTVIGLGHIDLSSVGTSVGFYSVKAVRSMVTFGKSKATKFIVIL